jgi:gliding motility-associated-like protein
MDIFSDKIINFECVKNNFPMMKLHAVKISLISLAMCFVCSVHAQQMPVIRMKTGDIPTFRSTTVPSVKKETGYFTAFISFADMPDASQKEALSKMGIKLLEYIPDFTWYAEFPINTAGLNLDNLGVVCIQPLGNAWKTEEITWHNGGPEWARIAAFPGWVEAIVFLNGKHRYEEVKTKMEGLGFVCYQYLPNFGTLQVRFPLEKLSNLLSIEGFYWMEPISPPVEEHNFPGRVNHRALTLNLGRPGGRNLWGKGITIGEWDGAGVGSHIDFNDRVINKNPFVSNSNGNHATHVCGTITGGGIIDPFGQGMAPKARLFGWDFFGNIPAEMDTACFRDSIVMTNNSYGYGSDPCATRGTYDGISRNLDILVNMYPYLSHQFSSGNSRSSNCAAGGYRTINSGFQSAKNIITVGALQFNDGNSTFHSYGPMRDGRMKPEICAMGVSVYSTTPFNTYQGGWNGTSMSCPGATGTIALLYERFKQLNSNKKPFNHTLKAIVCNTADDIGNLGPDYAFGFGRINAVSAMKVIEENTYKVDSVNHNGSRVDTVFVQPGKGRFQVMLVWDDIQAVASASPSLINDLDLEVQNPSGTIFRPWTLDPACHTCLPTRRRDSLNNAEQFYIDNPVSGKWVIRVRGKSVSTGNEIYTVTYSQIDNFVRVSYPNGHETMVPPTAAAPQTIAWDAFGTTGTFTVEYSADSGTTWNTIATGISNTTRYLTWNNAPATLNTRKALIRIKNGTLTDMSDTVFHIYYRANQPSGITCSNQVHLFWPKTTSAVSYRVLQSINSYMEPIGTTTDTFFTVTGLVNGLTYWFSLEAIGPNGENGPRCAGRSFTPTASPVAPTITRNPTSQIICAGNTLTLISGASGTATIGRQWQMSTDSGKTWQSLIGKNGDTLTMPNYSWNQRGRYYRNQYVNACRNLVFTQPAIIGVDTQATFTSHPTDQWRCEGDSVQWTVNVNSGLKPRLQWQISTNNGATWNNLTGDTLNTLKRKNLLFANNGERFRMLATNFCNTLKPSNVGILSVRGPLKLILPKDTLICFGKSVSLTAVGSGGDNTKYSFQWLGFPSGNSITVQPTQKTTYRITLDDQCTFYDAIDSVTVDVRGPLQLNAAKDTTLCAGRSVTLTAALSGGLSSGYQYLWTPGNVTTANYTVSPNSTTDYTVRALDGCTPDTLYATFKVTMRPALDIALNNDTLLCNGKPVLLKTTVSGGVAGSRVVSWNQGLGTGLSKTVAPPTTTTYRAILSDGCSLKNDTAWITVSVRAPLSLTLQQDTILCLGRSTGLLATPTGGLSSGYSIQWNQGLGSGLNKTVSPITTTIYRAILSDGCSLKNDTQEVTVTVRQPLNILSNNDTTLCYGNAIVLKTAASGGNALYQYRWEDIGSPFTSLGSSANLNLNPTATQTVRVILTDGCTVKSDTATVKITVLPNLSITTSPDTAVCAGDNAELRVKASGGKGNYQFTWTDLSDNSNAGNGTTLSVIPSSTSSYRIVVSDGCTVTQPQRNIQVQVVAQPLANLFFPSTTACNPGIFRITNVSSSASRFLINNRRYSGGDTTLKFNTGSHTVKLSAFNSLGCMDTASYTLTVHPRPKAGFTFTPSAPREMQTVTFTDQSNGATFWNWNLPHGLFNMQQPPVWTSLDTGTWSMQQIVGNAFACFDTLQQNIRVGVGYYLHIPTAFTPDQNGLNEVWKPSLRGIKNYRLRIYNRWGQLVFKTDNPQEGWNGEGAPQGTYVVEISVINTYDERFTERGTITLLR